MAGVKRILQNGVKKGIGERSIAKGAKGSGKWMGINVGAFKTSAAKLGRIQGTNPVKGTHGNWSKYNKPQGPTGKVLSQGWDNLKSVGLKDGQYGQAAIQGALINAGLQGTTEWAQGGSFWSGAKSGLVSGAAMGAGYRAFKIGGMGRGWNVGGEVASFSDAWGNYSKTVSKQVTAIQRNAQHAKAAKNINKLGGV